MPVEGASLSSGSNRAGGAFQAILTQAPGPKELSAR